MKFNIRRIIQAVFLLIFVILIFLTTYPLIYPNGSFLLLFDFFNYIVTGLASRSILPYFLPALSLLVITLLLGRFFCGLICPIGTLLDISDKFMKRKKISNKNNKISRKNKYILISLIFVTSVFGIQTYGIFSPFSIFTRTVVTCVFGPIYMLFKNISVMCDHLGYSNNQIVSRIFQPIGDFIAKTDLLLSSQFYFNLSLLFLLMFAGIIFLNTFTKRFWCRYLCPLGAFWGIISVFNIKKRKVSSDCNNCSICQNVCSMNAIYAEDFSVTSESDCIKCGTCSKACPKSAISFGGIKTSRAKSEESINESRRKMILGGFIGLITVAALKMDIKRIIPHQSKNVTMSSEFNLRPPNALPEHSFIATCIKCGACVKACPTNTLQFSLNEGANEAIWTPVVTPSVGACKQECNVCGEVCPTGAIKKFKISDKSKIIIGNAIVFKDKCLAWNKGEHCVVCQEYCSYLAVKLVREKGVPSPVITSKCVGCGACENACPVQPNAAIRVMVSDKTTIDISDEIEDSSEYHENNPYGF